MAGQVAHPKVKRAEGVYDRLVAGGVTISFRSFHRTKVMTCTSMAHVFVIRHLIFLDSLLSYLKHIGLLGSLPAPEQFSIFYQAHLPCRGTALSDHKSSVLPLLLFS